MKLLNYYKKVNIYSDPEPNPQHFVMQCNAATRQKKKKKKRRERTWAQPNYFQ